MTLSGFSTITMRIGKDRLNDVEEVWNQRNTNLVPTENILKLFSTRDRLIDTVVLYFISNWDNSIYY